MIAASDKFCLLKFTRLHMHENVVGIMVSAFCIGRKLNLYVTVKGIDDRNNITSEKNKRLLNGST